LDTLKQRREKELEDLVNKGQPTMTSNPVQQELQILLTKTEADISSIKARVLSFQKKQGELKRLVDTVPKIEAEMQRLNRDYEIHKERYNQLVQRRETAKITEDVDSGTEHVKFRIVEPPYVAYEPDYPNRVLFDAAILVLSLGVGYGFGFLLSLLRPVFYNINDLNGYTGMAVLGAVSKFDTVDVLDKRHRNLIMFVLANITVVCIGIVTMIAHSQGILFTNLIKSLVATL
jgi:polysaccharide chain length determinant protein (PEP-CTERM system associated)